ncbi:Nibrin [Colletotrichum fructicola Nara gc5]|uniref:Nibrin n=1 Tax=Colletotrichum fructicola (strain Nara gc5) TaxID=1213859 RepID=A0A7J6IQ87_COLFN|nr:Nibrin [Colletotrichum fructicola]KAF4479075.1 Nibrin [Colletotrichum fructicola Nara gc5]
MWLLENEGNALEGRRIWLRPGKLYLFGRTSANVEPGTLTIAHKTISRKHMTIQVDKVPEGDSQDLSSRSAITIEDLNTKAGTTVDGHKYKGEKHVVTEATAEIKIGGCTEVFRLTWHPVVLTFSFSSREMQADPLSRLRADVEQLDIKLTSEYDVEHTTHVVVKKRNTSKGLQALVNGKYIVTDSFVDAIVAAATSEPTAICALEDNFDSSWPDALSHLPPRGGEPVERPNAAYAPDEGRRDIFEGYTFIFYEKGQFENLRAPIINGKGKALYTKVTPNVTTVDEFILYVKTEAGEKGLGCFEDGSEGRGVVVVRYTPSKGDAMTWYADFFTQVSLRLDHRPIEQNEFLEAILVKDASILRRRLEIDPTQEPPRTAPQQASSSDSMDVDQPAPPQHTPQESAPSAPPVRPARVRRAATRRFAGFDNDDDDDDPVVPKEPESVPVNAEPETEEGLFVSQEAAVLDEIPDSSQETRTRRSQRKRPPVEDDSIMDDIIPNAAAAKRRRIEAGEDPDPRPKEPEPPKAPEPKPATKAKKVKQEIDVLEVARKRREELEAAAKAEKDDLRNLPADLDLAEIGRNQTTVAMSVRTTVAMSVRQRPATRTHEEDVASGRWNPAWNGRKNFKGFVPRGELTGRPRQKVIVPLKEVKKKDYGIGDEYWLEDDSQKKKKDDTQKSGRNTSQKSGTSTGQSAASRHVSLQDRGTISIVSSDEEDETPAPEPEPEPAPSRSRSSRATTTQSQATSQSLLFKWSDESKGAITRSRARRLSRSCAREVGEGSKADDNDADGDAEMVDYNAIEKDADDGAEEAK